MVLLRWHADPVVVLGLTGLALAWLWGVQRVPAGVAAARTRWFCAALAVLVVALCSPLATVSEERFSVHMAQHLLLTYGAAPLLAFAAPVTLALQALGPGAGRRRLLAALHSRVVRFVSHPAVTWLLFAGVMYVTHFSPLYDASLRNPVLHGVEHLLYLGAAALFWWPVVRRDPVPGSFPWPARCGYLFLAMPMQSFLGVAILGADRVLYAHYATRAGALADQHLAGAIMWAGGDVLMLSALACAVAAWFRADARATVRLDAHLDALRAGR
ncbi:MAG TPA: cytochrome c oxidase assembly protein [Mycobacteriales bacterium]|nr:cytochrome c oxidase assembly protein [Mycobacteriales bacterium]